VNKNRRAVFSVGPGRDVIAETCLEVSSVARVEVGSNTSAAALRVVGRDEKGT
jgi:hypothetical protein